MTLRMTQFVPSHNIFSVLDPNVVLSTYLEDLKPFFTARGRVPTRVKYKVELESYVFGLASL
jgi:hypothetical protein